MKVFWIVLSFLLCSFIVFLTYMGVFHTITIVEKSMGPYYFIYKEMRGNDMSEIGTITTELHSFLTSKEFEAIKPFDIFYPENSGANNEIGFIINGIDSSRLEIGNDIRFKRIPEQTYMTTEFPFRNRLSFLVGFIKIDPALRQYRETRAYRQTPAMTINEEEKIIYLQSIIPMK